MRLLCEVFIIGGLLYLGWDTPFQNRLPWTKSSATKPAIVIARPAVAPAAAATPQSAGWMHDPNRRTVLDTPTPVGVHHQPHPGASPPGSWMFDPNHLSPLDPPKRSVTPH